MLSPALVIVFLLANVALADVPYYFTNSFNPAPVPGQPFTLTWTGGEPTSVVYIVLESYFELTPNQNIVYGPGQVILSSAPNNGSWTYNVPMNIAAGRHSFGIGPNPILQSDGSPIFRIDASQTGPVTPGPAPTTTESFTPYNGCGLPPIPGYTYTGYQPPCTVTSNGALTTIYPLAPASIRSLWNTLGGAPIVPTNDLPTPSDFIPLPSVVPPTSIFATGIASALECLNPVRPSRTSIVVAETTTIFDVVGCTTRRPLLSSSATSEFSGVCHSGYATFSVQGASSVCCPRDWDTSTVGDIYCYTSAGSGVVERDIVGVASDVVGGSTIVTGVLTSISTGDSAATTRITGLIFTRAGVVADTAVQTGTSSLVSTSTSGTTGSGTITGSSTSGTGTAGTITSSSSTSSSSAAGNSGSIRIGINGWIWALVGAMMGLRILV